MTRPAVKICGLMDETTIVAMNGLPIDEIGLVFAPSRRQVDKETAASLVSTIHQLKTAQGEAPRAVGVFVNEPVEQICELLSEVPLDVVQLHGDETPDYCKQLKELVPSIHIWRVFSVRAQESAANVDIMAAERLAPYVSLVDAILIDAPGGGTGQPFNWSVIDAYKKEAAALGLPLYVAGGLHPDNVQELLRNYSPDGIDVSSGVETDGCKDIDKIRLFVRRVIEG